MAATDPEQPLRDCKVVCIQMTFYTSALSVFVVGNVVLFTSYMRITGQPWEGALVFFGYVLTNAPIVVSMFTARKIDRTLKGHWLNYLNILIPIAVGTAGLVTYIKLALHPEAHPAIFLFGPLMITAGWFTLFSVLVMTYVFVPSR